MVVTRLGTDDGGRPLLVKAADPASAASLRHEAALLSAARHPGVVEVASATAYDDGSFELCLRWIGNRTAADVRPTVEAAAGMAAALAATVADLHGLGIRHGRIRPDHVVIDGAGRPVLVGFGSAAWADEPGAASECDDAAGIGEVLRALVGAETDLEPIPDSRFGRRPAWPGATRRALLMLADHATDDEPGRRPTARRLAAAIAAAVPSVDEPARSRRRFAAARRRPWRVAIGAAGLALLAGGVSSLLASPMPAPSPLALPTSAATPLPTAAALDVAACPAVHGLVADHDGDGCASAVSIDGGVVEVGGVRYAVGRAGDVLAIGDWDCDGAATIVALRPTTGEVYVFDGWAAPGDDLVVTATATVPGAASVQSVDADDDGCATLVVRDADGITTEVAT